MTLEAARAHFARVDPVFHAATAEVMPRVANRPREPYEALLRAIVGQQLSTKAASTIWGRFSDRFGGIPEPQALASLDDEVLRGVGLSYRKASYVRAVADAALAGELHGPTLLALKDDDIIERLTRIRGVGRWTVEMILMFGMERPDVFSAGDLGIRQGMAKIHGLDPKARDLAKQVTALAEPLAPFRSTACRLLWAYNDGD